MYTYSGRYVTETDGAPTVMDVAIALGRIPRLCAHGSCWWSYLHHSFALMELAFLENESYHLDEVDVAIQALIREAHRSVTLLWEPARDFAEEVQQRIHEAWDVPYPHPESEMRELLDRTASRAFVAEVSEFGPRSMKELEIFEDVRYQDKEVINWIWNRRHDPNSTAGHLPEPAEAYAYLFDHRDEAGLARARHLFGYRMKWQTPREVGIPESA